MNDTENNIVIGQEPILQFGLFHNETDDLTEAYLVTGADEENVGTRSPLSPEEKERLAECEKEINEYMEGFVIVGQRLAEIKAKKLFRETHHSFHQYCLDRFGFGRIYANRVIGASKCVENLKTMPNGTVSTPATEAEARPISNLPPEDQKKVAKKVKENVGDRKPTAKDFEQAKAEVLPEKAAKKRKPAQPKGAEEGREESATLPSLPNPPTSTSLTGGFVRPAEFHPNAKLLSLVELSDLAEKLYMHFDNPQKKKDMGALVFKLREHLRLYAHWEKAGFGAKQLQEAA